MRITFKRDVDCDYFDRRMNESYPKVFKKWDNLIAEAVEDEGRIFNVALFNGDTIMNIPKNAVEISR